MIAVTSDDHWGDLRSGDIADYEGAAQILDLISDLRPDMWVKIGDWLDYTRCGKRQVLKAQEGRLRGMSFRLRCQGIPLIWVPGNHDRSGRLTDISPFGFDGGWANTVSPSTVIDGWLLEHGHRFDLFNKGLPFSPLAHALTRATGYVQEHWWPGLKDSWINPVAWISASQRSQARKNVLHDLAIEAAIKEGIDRICIGHTHTLDEKRGLIDQNGHGLYHFVNAGACTKEQAPSLVVLYADARVDLYEFSHATKKWRVTNIPGIRQETV
jgi:DNA repair exonuclease SbcCD nuclease subunit